MLDKVLDTLGEFFNSKVYLAMLVGFIAALLYMAWNGTAGFWDGIMFGMAYQAFFEHPVINRSKE